MFKDATSDSVEPARLMVNQHLTCLKIFLKIAKKKNGFQSATDDVKMAKLQSFVFMLYIWFIVLLQSRQYLKMELQL